MSSSSEDTVRLLLRGQEYTLRNVEEPERLRLAADRLNQMLAQLARTSSQLGGERLAMLAALNLSDELEALRAEGLERLSSLEAKVAAELS